MRGLHAESATRDQLVGLSLLRRSKNGRYRKTAAHFHPTRVAVAAQFSTVPLLAARAGAPSAKLAKLIWNDADEGGDFIRA